ncbi:aspartate--tRNA(Asn) ligase [Spirochaeta cellobiosiphila]|uniref:aspartate--tRNA(Asn) ligase n=1 Tax=Spirochaeta cellobiosiphila TaxID=504483 RepID=UPI00041BA311|nr:aspartate--tRNA(Asn) ligase [Spirochaeta cellobiosiphila]
MRVLASEANKHVGETIEVKGWIHRIRDLGQVVFIVLRDRSGEVQIVLDNNPELSLESVIKIEGNVIINEKSPGGVEIECKDLTLLAPAAPNLPISVNQNLDKLSLDAILDNRMISLRNTKIRDIFLIQSNILKALSSYMHSQDFSEIKTSKLIGSGTEGGTGLFSVEYFDEKVFLAQSPQFYKQAMVSSGLERVFEISHAYRAEKHETPRHLNEYVSFDVEMAFIETEKDLIDFEKGILKHVFEELRANCSHILEKFDTYLPTADEVDKFPIIEHSEAKKIISKEVGHRVFEINPEGERVICEWAKREYGVEAVFINAFPRKKRPFYTFPDGLKTMSFDCIFRGLEITTGGRRINEYNMMLETLPRFGMTPEGLGDYMDIFKFGCPPHGGFAIGVERLTQKILGLSNVKEASPFPRDRKRVKP